MIIACPIKGQVRMECASPPSCHRACNRTGPIACPAICIVNGCQCPPGTVIDWDKNECVLPRQCEGIQHTQFVQSLPDIRIHAYFQ